MTDFRTRNCPRWLATLVFASALAGMLIAAAYVMFSAFMFYDDEGYVLLSLRNYAEHGGLYREVYSQYGPFPFVFYHALQEIGTPLTHTTGRLITLAVWGSSAVCCALLAGQVTQSLLARLSVLVVVFLYLWVMANEPTHPGGIIVLLTSLAALLGHRWIVSGKSVRLSILVGATGAALLLTKVNIGIFFGFSAGAWWLLQHRDDRIRRWAMMLVSGCVVAMPVALMRPLLGTAWVQTFALLFVCSGIAVAVSAAVSLYGRAGWREFWQAIIAGSIVTGAVLGAVIVRGTGLADLWHGLILEPLSQPTNFSLRFLWPAAIDVFAVVSLAGCIISYLLRKRHRPAIDVTVALLRLLSVVGLTVNILRFPVVSPAYLIFGCALPCLWLFVWSLSGENETSSSARTWVVLLLLGQSLHVFPVPGSQIAWGTTLTIPLAAVGAWDAARWLAHRSSRVSRVSPRIMTASAVLILAVTGAAAWKFSALAARYHEGTNLGLPGAELIRVPEDSAATLRVLTHNAAAHSDVLFSLPGMFSFNLWTGLPTPTRANVTHWFSLLDESKQVSIVRELESHPRACVIVQRGHINFLVQRGLRPEGLLYEYITREFEPAFTIGDVEFCVRRGRQIKPYMLAELMTRSDAAPRDAESTLLTFTMLVPPVRPVSRIEVSTRDPNGRRFVLNSNNSRVEFATVNVRGHQSASPRPAQWPLQVSAPCKLWIYYRGEALPPPVSEATIVLRDEHDDEVGLARLSQ